MNIQAILPYKSSSNSAKLLASALNVKRIKLLNSRFRLQNNKRVLNWGHGTYHPRVSHLSQDWINHPNCVASTTNKLATFDILTQHSVPHLEWTRGILSAAEWLLQGHKVYARTILNSHSGAGIVILNNQHEIIEAPLYTKHFKKHKEYRVHVGIHPVTGARSVIHIQQKRLRENAPEGRIGGIRNHANGWIFACNNVDPLNDQQLKVAMDGVAALGLNFGGVDLLVDREGNAVICEINSAPGIEGTTLQQYVNFFRSI